MYMNWYLFTFLLAVGVTAFKFTDKIISPFPTSSTVDIQCLRESLTGDIQNCTCEGMTLGPGIVGDSNDSKAFADFNNHPSNAVSLWEFSAFLRGSEVPLLDYKAKATVVVNVASG